MQADGSEHIIPAVMVPFQVTAVPNDATITRRLKLLYESWHRSWQDGRCNLSYNNYLNDLSTELSAEEKLRADLHSILKNLLRPHKVQDTDDGAARTVEEEEAARVKAAQEEAARLKAAEEVAARLGTSPYEVYRLGPKMWFTGDLMSWVFERFRTTNWGGDDVGLIATSQFYELLKQKKDVTKLVQKALGDNYLEKKTGLIVIPVHTPAHWVLVVIDLHERNVCLLDSLKSEDPALTATILQTMKAWIESSHRLRTNTSRNPN